MITRKYVLVLVFSLILSFSFVSQVSASGLSAITSTVYLPVISVPPPPPGVYLMSNHSYYRSGDYLHVVGEVYNNIGGAIGSLRIIADFYDGQGKLVDTDYTYSYLGKVPNGSLACYDILLEEPPGWMTYKLSGTYYRRDYQIPALQVFNHSSSITSFGWYRVIGEVKNVGSIQIESVQPVVTLYNSSGIVLDCDFTYANIDDLNPGQVSSFEVNLLGRDDYGGVTHYRIETDGNPQ